VAALGSADWPGDRAERRRAFRAVARLAAAAILGAMSDQRLPLAFAASSDTCAFDARYTALVLADAEHPPLPEGSIVARAGFAVRRHAGSAAAAQAGACSCCRVP